KNQVHKVFICVDLLLRTTFFAEHCTDADAHIHARTVTPMKAHTHTLPAYPYEHLRETEPPDLEIDELTADAL
uniref:Uncharacterized protein n=1 Tax=Aegilops tauschii subsp. strangulata TaxID=200361 RepID=A0A453JWB9_AEGTS